MQALSTLNSFGTLIILLALTSTRIAVAFLLLPAFSPDILPATIRNAIFIAFGIVTLSIQPALDTRSWSAGAWVYLFAKEAFLGIALGILLGSILWAFETAGQMIDTHAGATQAQVNDPLSGQQTTLSGAFLGRLANFIFMFGGGFLFWVGCITESFSIWPIAALNINFSLQSSKIFELAFANFAQTAILWAAPAMVTLFIVDAMLGLANRFAPQLNVYSMSAAVKSLAAMFVWILMLTTFVTTAQDDILALIKNVIPMMLGIVPAASGR